MKKKHLVLVLTEPTEGNEDAFNDYYENTHLDEVIASAGWQSAQRFKLVGQAGESAPLPYLAVYEAEGEDADDVLAQLNDSRDQRQQSKTLDKRTGRIWVYEDMGPRHAG
jgi:hypothetical protein